MKSSFGTKKDTRNKILLAFLFLLLAALTCYAVVKFTKDLTFESFLAFVRQAELPWLIAAIAAALLYIVFAAASLLVFCRTFGYPRSLWQGISFSSATIYFSAITPSATGGQPACAYFMVKSGVPVMLASMALIANLALYALSVFTIGLVGLIINPHVLSFFEPIAIILIIMGLIFQICGVVFLCLVLWRTSLVHKLGNFGIRVGCKWHLIKNREKVQQQLDDLLDEYSNYSSLLKGKYLCLFKAFLCNMGERISIMMVSVFSYLACGGTLDHAFDVFNIQSCVQLSSTFIPVPGSMGASDAILIDGLNALMDQTTAASLELLSRGISFYGTVMLCFLIVIISFIVMKNRARSKPELD